MNNLQERKPAVSGTFYPAGEQELKTKVEAYLNKAQKKSNDKVIAVISPHAGYVFSGEVAAMAIKQIPSEKEFENVFVIGVSHSKMLGGASVFAGKRYLMPGFSVDVNTDIAEKLISASEYITFDPEAHLNEHSIEVQLPFLYYHLKHNFKIVPILIGTHSLMALKDIAKALKPYFNANNVFVFSSDFSHYPPYEDAIENDKRTAEALISNNVNKFIETLQKNLRKGIPDLKTSACGTGGLITLLYLTENQEYTYKIIDYKNSGDSPYGDKDSVVGYYAIAVESRQADKFSLTEAEKQQLLTIARKTLDIYTTTGTIPEFDETEFGENLKKNLGAFVTLTNKGKLRGCIGRFQPEIPLWKVVRDMTVAAASRDTRFLPVGADEKDDIKIEISVLTPLQKINSPDELVVGRDGIYIKKGANSGTLLPQVATENNWDKMQFIEYCSQYKAGIGKDGWKQADLFIYQAIIFDEKK